MSSDTPQPDPSVRTVETVHREIGMQRELFDVRLTAADRAQAVIDRSLEQVPDRIIKEIGHLQDLHDTKFHGIEKQFAERDIRTEQASAAAAQALAAALQAAKELVGAQGEASAAAAVKSETAFTKQFEQIVATITTLTDAIDKRITELKERIDRGEGNSDGARTSRDDRRNDSGLLVTIFGAVLVAVGIIMPILTR